MASKFTMSNSFLTTETCFYCGKDLLFNESKYEVKGAIKPKGSRNRWFTIGITCEDCFEDDSKPYHIENIQRVQTGETYIVPKHILK